MFTRDHIIPNPDSAQEDLEIFGQLFSGAALKHFGYILQFDTSCEQVQQKVRKFLVRILRNIHYSK